MKLLIGCLAAAIGATALAQDTQPPIFRAGADLVAVDAVVLDKSAHPVLDLGAADFEVREDGNPQPIDQFYLVRSSGAAAVSATPAAPEGGAAASPPVATRRVFIALFDNDHLSPGGFKRVQAAALDLFAKEFRAGDVGGVVVHGEMTNKRLTSEKEELIAAVRAAKPDSKKLSQLIDLREWPTMNEAEAVNIARYGLRNDNVLDEVKRRACADDPSACKPPVDVDAIIYAKAQQIAVEIRASSDVSLRTMGALMNGLERIEGRKTILLLTEGMITDESWPLVQQTVGMAARANARIYTLDARGLDKIHFGNYAPHDDTLGNLLESFDIGADSVNSLAVDTGGYVVRNTNIFDRAIAQIADEAGTYYVLGYRSPARADGKFHKISVSVKRQGLTVRARRGYVATPAPARPAVTTPAAAPPSPAPSPAAPPPAAPPPAAPTTTAPEEATAAVPPERSESTDTGRIVEPGERSNTSTGTEVRLRPGAVRHVEDLGSIGSAARDANAEAGWQAYQRGDLESARTSLAAAAGASGAHPWVHYALGQANYGLRQYRDAVTEWQKVLAAAPEFEPVYFDLVDGCLQLKDYDLAMRMIRTATTRWPKDAEVFNALGVVQVARGALDDAIKSFGEAIATAPKDGVGYYNLARAHDLRYVRSRRYVTTTRTWFESKPDKDAAIENYNRYLSIGGPFEKSAREALTRLGWTASPQ